MTNLFRIVPLLLINIANRRLIDIDKLIKFFLIFLQQFNYVINSRLANHTIIIIVHYYIFLFFYYLLDLDLFVFVGLFLLF